MSFISLHNHTHFSVLDAIPTPEELMERAKELGQEAVAITDHGSLAGVWSAYKAWKTTGVKPIIGCECYFVDDKNQLKEKEKFRHIILIAKNAIGYKNLLTINRRGFENINIDLKKAYSIIDWKLLEKHKEGLICLTSCGNGILSSFLMKKDLEGFNSALNKLKEIFKDDLGLEIQTNNLARNASAFHSEVDQNFINRQMIFHGKKHGIKVVPTCNSHYLKKEDYKIHDVMIAIAAHQPIYSNFRLKYPVPDFYLKSELEVKDFFSRNYGEELAQQLVDNTKYFADKCENPDWIDPKFSNSTGKELPIFPVKDEKDYSQFLIWSKNQSEKIQALKEDEQFLRYRTELGLKAMIPVEKFTEYQARCEEEFDVLEYHGFSSYMLIVADYVNWAKNNGVPTGPGRGCLTGDTKVQTTKGFKQLKDIVIGDKVYTHTGKAKEVLKTFEYDVNEDLLQLTLINSFGNIKLTKDHKVYASHDPKIAPSWIEAKDLKLGSYVYTKFPETDNPEYEETFDLSKYCDHNKFTDTDIQVIKGESHNDGFSMREISRAVKLHYGCIFDIKNNKSKCIDKIKKVESYLNIHNLSLKDWQNRSTSYDVERFIKLDDEFLYILGRFTGDGSFRKGKSDGLNFAFHKNEVEAITRVRKYFENKGFSIYECTSNKKNYNGYSLKIGNRFLSQFFADIFCNYKSSSLTKHYPKFFRQLSKRQMKILLQGHYDSDGCFANNKNSIKTISPQLSFEMKEIANYLSEPCGFNTEKAKTTNNNGIIRRNKTSHKMNFGLFDDAIQIKQIFENGYYSKISKIDIVKEDKVYDIMVEEDHSYLTSSGIVHNSAGGCLIAYLIGIHNADSIKYDLIFARFHNKEKTLLPDIDVDVSTKGREQVLHYLCQKYGQDNVAHVSNINTMTPKVYAKDIARVCEFGGSADAELGMAIANSIPDEAQSIDHALAISPIFTEYCKRYPQLLENKIIDGKLRAFSTHAGGIIISQRPLVGLVPVRLDKEGNVALEYDKDQAEENGLVKMDILGLSTLDIIDKTHEIMKNVGLPIPTNHDYKDQKTYDLISKGDTFCVFQLGTSGGTAELCRQVQPTSINDISHINSLARPSAKDMRTPFVQTKAGKKPVSLLHPSLQRSFGKTYGFGLYEESLFYLAQDVAGWTLNEADRLRKMTKDKGKNPEKVKKLRKEFIEGGIKKGISEYICMQVWDDVVDKFQGYGFNLSHSVMYSMISYDTAFLKANYPVPFLLANLMLETAANKLNSAEKIQKIKNELRAHKVEILPPDINKSQMVFTLEKDKLITSLNALKFVSDDAIKDIISKRPFKDFIDFMTRVDSKKVRSNTIQALAASGALDSFGVTRKNMFLYCQDFRKRLQVWLKTHDISKEKFVYEFENNNDEWQTSELYAFETKYVGEGFICKASKAYQNFFNDAKVSVKQINSMVDKDRVADVKFIIKDLFEIKIKKPGKLFEKPMLKLLLEDAWGDTISGTIFPSSDESKFADIYKKLHKMLKASKIKLEPGIGIRAAVSVNMYNDNLGVIINDLYQVVSPPALPPDLDKRKITKEKTKTSVKISDTEEELLLDGFLSEKDD